jgi:hypothetical protein
MAITTQTISLADLEELSHDELAERFKESDLELCVEPLSEWGSDLEELFQKLEKGVMQWYETGIKRSLVICFLDEAKETVSEPAKQEATASQESEIKEEIQPSAPLATPVILPN